MKTVEQIPIKKVALKNNCPECFSADGLQLTFKQRSTETSFYTSISSDVSHELFCNTCDSIIYPERWTDDIERVFEYQQKAFTPKQASKQFKKNFWIGIIIVLIAVFAAIVFFLFYFEDI